MAVIDKQINYMGLPMNIQRGNPIPLDNTSVWYSKDKMETYAKEGLTAYVGQILSLVNEETDEVTAYIIINEAGDLQEVGSATAGDGKTIVLDEATGKLSLAGIVKDGEGATEAGALPTYQADGSIAWIKPSTDTVEGLQTEVASQGQRLTAAESDIDAIETKINGMGGILNLAATVTEEQFITSDEGTYAPSKFDAGDVILISDNGKEYVCVEDSEGKKSWELLGDADGVTALQGRVSTLESNDTTQNSNISALQTAVGAAQDGETAATGLYAYADSKASAAQAAAISAANAYTDGKVKEVADAEAENAKNIATNTGNITSLTNRVSSAEGTIASHTTSIGEINTALDSKANSDKVYTKDEADALLVKKADKDSFDSLKSTVDSHDKSIATLNQNAKALQDEIDAVEVIANANKTTIGTTDDEASVTGSLYARIKKNAADVAAAQAKADDGFGKANSAQSDVNSLKETVEEHTTAINGLNADVAAVKTTVEANETAIAGIKNDYQTKAAATEQHETLNEAIAKNTSDIASVSGEVLIAEGNIKTLETNSATKAELAAVKTELMGDGESDSSTSTIAGAKKYTDEKVETVSSRVTSVENKLDSVTNVMNFAGVYDSTEAATTAGKNRTGNVILVGAKEYVYDGAAEEPAWVEFGDSDANTAAIGKLQTVVGDDKSGLVADVAKNTSDIATTNTTMASNKTELEGKITTLNELVVENENDIEGKMTAAKSSISALETAIGGTDDAAGTQTVYGAINKNKADIATTNTNVTSLRNEIIGTDSIEGLLEWGSF